MADPKANPTEQTPRVVKYPDGTVAHFPGNLTDDQLHAAATSLWNKIKDGADRLVTNFSRNIGAPERAKDIIDGPIQAVTHPIDSAKLILDSVGDAQANTGKRALKEAKEGKYVPAIAHGIEYLIPLAGPALEHAGDQFEQGDIAGGIGSTAGIAAGLLTGKLLKSPGKVGVIGPEDGAALVKKPGIPVEDATPVPTEDVPFMERVEKLFGIRPEPDVNSLSKSQLEGHRTFMDSANDAVTKVMDKSGKSGKVTQMPEEVMLNEHGLPNDFKPLPEYLLSPEETGLANQKVVARQRGPQLVKTQESAPKSKDIDAKPVAPEGSEVTQMEISPKAYLKLIGGGDDLLKDPATKARIGELRAAIRAGKPVEMPGLEFDNNGHISGAPNAEVALAYLLENKPRMDFNYLRVKPQATAPKKLN